MQVWLKPVCSLLSFLNLVRRLSQLLKEKIPDTYAVADTVQSEFGEFPVRKEKGEGGACSLERRIAYSFYNKFIR